MATEETKTSGTIAPVQPPGSRKGLAIASLALGFVSLVTAGGCGVGALAGLTLGVVALMRARRDPYVDAGRDVAWAGIVTNGLAVLTIVPVFMLLAMLNSTGALPGIGGEEELPEPHPASRRDTLLIPDAPPAPTAPPSAAPATPSPRTSAASRPRTSAEAPPPPQAVRIGGTIREPAKLKNVPPVYPDVAKQARVQGVVILEATISPRGKVTTVRVLRGVPLLDEAAIEAVKQWEYTPTLLNGVPVPVIMTVTLNFRLQ
jgi:protein TonB